MCFYSSINLDVTDKIQEVLDYIKSFNRHGFVQTIQRSDTFDK